MVEETLSERLARRHATLQLDEVPLEIVQAAKLHILDSLGCLLAGSRLEPGKLAYALAIGNHGSSSSVTSTLLGAGSRVSFLEAVQAMSVAAHCGEMDDIHGGAGTCIGGIIVPALVAMAEEQGGSGCNFLEAAIVGYETTARVGLAIDAPRLFSRGWWPSTVCGVFGVAAAGAKFLGWPPDQTAKCSRHRIAQCRRDDHRRTRGSYGAAFSLRSRRTKRCSGAPGRPAGFHRAEARL
jgi:2-methylcitrate dehydratase PrpD